jgi:hypothetical protein
MEHHLISFTAEQRDVNCELSRQMMNYVYKGKCPKVGMRDKPLQLQGRTEIITDRDGEGDD